MIHRIRMTVVALLVHLTAAQGAIADPQGSARVEIPVSSDRADPGFTSPSFTSPSFRCLPRMTAPEHAICDNAVLADLDRVMAEIYRRHRQGAGQDRRMSLQKDQRLWLQWRDTCGAAVSCLRRRYEQRIIDLTPKDALPPGFGCRLSPYGSVQIGTPLLPEG